MENYVYNFDEYLKEEVKSLAKGDDYTAYFNAKKTNMVIGQR